MKRQRSSAVAPLDAEPNVVSAKASAPAPALIVRPSAKVLPNNEPELVADPDDVNADALPDVGRSSNDATASENASEASLPLKS